MSEPSFAFTCIKCGKCCMHGGPALSIEEVFKYQDTFITGLRWDCKSIPKKHVFTFKGEPADAQKMRNHFATFCPASFDDKGDTVHIHIYPLVTGYYTERPCPALNNDEGTCNLHHDKPTMCRSIPFDPALPEEMQGIMLRNFGHDCMTKTPAADDTASVIYRNGKITDPGCKADYDRRLAVMQKDQPTIGPLTYLARLAGSAQNGQGTECCANERLYDRKLPKQDQSHAPCKIRLPIIRQRQPNFASLFVVRSKTWPKISRPCTRAKIVEVDALPAHRHLDHAMEFAERESRRHKNTPPDHRADPDQPDFDLQERLGVRGERRRILFRKGLLRPPFHQARLPRQPGTPQFVMLSDKGYYKGEDIQAGEEAGIDAYVARPQRGSAVSHRLFRKEEFRYDPGSDTYLCPGAQRLEPRYHSEVKGHALVNYPAGATIMRRKAVRVERRRRLGRG